VAPTQIGSAGDGEANSSSPFFSPFHSFLSLLLPLHFAPELLTLSIRPSPMQPSTLLLH
jgi:hypothetical protein